jgi:membrane protein
MAERQDGGSSPVAGARAAASSAKSWVDRAKATPLWRAWDRYGKLRGNVLAGGIGYAGFFSLIPALFVGFTVFGLVLGNNADLQARLVDAVNSGLGTPIIKTSPTADGIVEISALTGGTELTIAGVIGLVGLLLTGLGWLDAIREGIRAMFGQPVWEGNAVVTKLRDVAVLATLGVTVLFSAIAGLAVGSVADTVLEWVGLDSSVLGKAVLGAASVLVLLVVDTAVFLVLFRLLAGVRLPRHDLIDAALFGGVGLGVLKLLANLLLSSAQNNRFLAAFAVVVVPLVWLNLVSRVTLVAASWGATVAMDRGHLVDAGPPQLLAVAPIGVPRPRVAAVSRPEPVVSPRAADRVSLAAGAVLGLSAAVAANIAGGALRSVGRALRRD